MEIKINEYDFEIIGHYKSKEKCNFMSGMICFTINYLSSYLNNNELIIRTNEDGGYVYFKDLTRNPKTLEILSILKRSLLCKALQN